MKRMHVKLTFIEPVLGTWPSNQNIAREFIASKSPDAASIEDEVAAIGADAVADKGMTVFPRNDDGQPVLYDYQVKGFFKDACGMLSRVSLANSEEIPEGSGCEFDVVCLDDAHEKAVREWLDYGRLRGIGQWRNSGKGRFTYEITD